METSWTLITIIASTIVATGTVLGIYYTHKHKIEERVKELENKVQHHEKFIEILEKKALQALDDEFNKNGKKK
ncbi:hypothetical protein [Psychroserpens burtonensis]|uniref:hypothetical protein n=1 Tax=Psychroserpens burtonensis TaxID=49278 RepID=UPI00042529BE|nr:hypothetical protein [Psychroserpens burtonensis]|tara:strand:+ start:138 stop:356 length:219 start_codon:yes stop_codon:yes gene_type:complete